MEHNQRNRERQAARIARVIEQMICKQQLQSGDKLPTERQLALQFKISRPTLREALCILEYKGVIDIRPGNGTFVKQAKTLYAQHTLFPAEFAQDAKSWEEIFQLRLLVEPVMIEAFVGHITVTQLQALEANLARMHQAIEAINTSQMLQSDADFHYMLATMSGNRLWAHQLGVMVNFLAQGRYQFLQIRDQYGALKEHADIVAALRTGNASQANTCMYEHLKHGMKALVAALKETQSRQGQDSARTS